MGGSVPLRADARTVTHRVFSQQPFTGEVSIPLQESHALVGLASGLNSRSGWQHLLFALPLAVVDLATVGMAFLLGCEISEQLCGVHITRQLSQTAVLVSTAF